MYKENIYFNVWTKLSRSFDRTKLFRDQFDIALSYSFPFFLSLFIFLYILRLPFYFFFWTRKATLDESSRLNFIGILSE